MASPDGLLIVDYAGSGRPLGVEITAPQAVPLGRLNQLLAFAALKTRAPVIEGMGLRNFGAHSNNAECGNISSIGPRLDSSLTFELEAHC